MAGLSAHAANSGLLLQRCSGVISDLQVDVGGLLWEIDQRQGSSFHGEVAAGLPGILAAAQAAAAGPGEGACGSGGSGPASPEDAGRQLLRAAEDRVGLLQRAYDTITGLQLDVDACLWELEAASGAHLGSTPLPFPSLTPLGHGKPPLMPTASAAAAVSGSAAQEGVGSGGAEGLAALAASVVRLTEQQHEASGAAGNLGSPPTANLASAAEEEEEDEAARFGSSTGEGNSGGTPPSKQAHQPRHAAPPAVLSPTTTAFVGAAYAARDTEAAEHAAQPRAVLDTSLKDADVETGRMATVRKQLERQAAGLAPTPAAGGANLAGRFEQAALRRAPLHAAAAAQPPHAVRGASQQQEQELLPRSATEPKQQQQQQRGQQGVAASAVSAGAPGASLPASQQQHQQSPATSSFWQRTLLAARGRSSASEAPPGAAPEPPAAATAGVNIPVTDSGSSNQAGTANWSRSSSARTTVQTANAAGQGGPSYAAAMEAAEAVAIEVGTLQQSADTPTDARCSGSYASAAQEAAEEAAEEEKGLPDSDEIDESVPVGALVLAAGDLPEAAPVEAASCGEAGYGSSPDAAAHADALLARLEASLQQQQQELQGSVPEETVPPAQSRPPARLLRRLLAAHAQHDSVGSVGHLTDSGGSAGPDQEAGPSPAAAGAEMVVAVASGASEAVAAEAADLAQHLIRNAYSAMQQQAAATQAEAAAAKQAAALAEAGARALEAQGRYSEAAAAAMDADRLCAAVEPAVQAASDAASHLQQFELEVAAVGEAAEEALGSPSDKPASNQAAAAATALCTAVKWAGLAGAPAVAPGPATGLPGQQDEAGPATAQLLARAAALLEQLPARRECVLSRLGCAQQLQHQQEVDLKPVRPQVLQAWRAEAMQPSAAADDSGGEVSEQALRSSSQSKLPEAASGSEDAAAHEGEVLAAWLHASSSAVCSSTASGQLGASSVSACTSGHPAGPAAQTQQPLQVRSSQLPQPHQQQEHGQQEHGSMLGSALAAGGAASSLNRQHQRRSSNTQAALHQPAARPAVLASRVCSAAAAMTSKQERALARAKQADLEAERMLEAGWPDAAAAASAAANKWRSRAEKVGRVAQLARQHARSLAADAGTPQLLARLNSGGAATGPAPDALPAAVGIVTEGASAAVAARRAEETRPLPAAPSGALLPALPDLICSTGGGSSASSCDHASPAAVKEPASQPAGSMAGTQPFDSGASISRSSRAHSPGSSGASLPHAATHATSRTSLGSGNPEQWQAGVSDTTSCCRFTCATGRTNRVSYVGSHASSTDDFVSAAASPPGGSGNPAGSGSLSSGSRSATGSGSPGGVSSSPTGSSSQAGNGSPSGGSSSPSDGNDASRQSSCHIGRESLPTQTRETDGSFCAVLPCPDTLPASSSLWAAEAGCHSSGGSRPAVPRPLAVATGQPLPLEVATASGADSSSHRLAPRPLPSFCQQQQPAGSSSTGAPAGTAGGQGGCTDLSGRQAAADLAAAAAPPPASVLLSADGQPGASGGTASPAACRSSGGRGALHSSAAVDRSLTTLQQQLDRLEGQLARSRLQRREAAAGLAASAAARRCAASDTGGGTTWLHGFGRGSLTLQGEGGTHGLEGGSKRSSSLGSGWLSGFR